jgi:alkylation response protein AidB-like acyl-CoA dehydrogenase
MHIGLTPEQDALRAELRAYFDTLMTPEERKEMESDEAEFGGGETYRKLIRRMGADGWLGIGWPTEFGGQGRSPLEQLIFTEEANRAGAPLPVLTINTVGPTLMRYGTDEQKAAFLPKILRGELLFSIGYSEPGAGTDLASLTTRAVRDGDEYVINGQKMWTSLIAFADYVWLAVRTDPTAPKHKGLSIVIVPTDAPGFKWSEIRTMAGPSTSVTFYEDVRVPVANLVGGENDGWKLITNQLNHERVALCPVAGIQTLLADVQRWAAETSLADGRRVIDQEWVRTHLARVYAGCEFLKLISWKVASAKDVGPADASATKVFATEFYVEAYRLIMDVLGQESYLRADSPGALLKGRAERWYRLTLILTFGGGTNEVQRDIIATTGLGMPRTR